jgi:YfiH family protein
MNSNSEQLTVISYQLFEKQNEIAHFCTSREGGVSVGNYASFNLSPFTGDNTVHVAENQRILCDEFGIDSEKLIIPFQTHGTEIREIDDEFFKLSVDEKNKYLNGIDALITNLAGVCIGITTADCVPLLFFDPVRKAVAVAHAGWRGTCARMAEKTALAMVQRYNCEPSDILVAIGPSISAEVYNVGKEVVDSFETAGFDVLKIVQIRNNTFNLDLWKANQQSLEKAGILPEHIEVSGICTFTEHEKFFSARRLGVKSGRMLSAIILKK